MTPEIWQRAQHLFHDALELSEADRHAWLQEACAGDDVLLALVLELMATDAAVSEQSIAPAVEVLQNAERPELQIGQILGSYQITAFIGAGGMGQVFRAERTDGVVKQIVAIKLLRFSASAAELKRRFAIERRILARLNHPGIARFLDAGSDQADRPFVVMELIDGLPINQYCTEQKLSLTQRLQLFAKVLDAVAYAHRQLIVHRDLKPGNILVDSTGQPKLLDFGIAKPLSDIDEALRADGHTETTMRAFSIKYAAPEQMRGDPIGVGVDIYALGGVLYELLTGSTALDLRDLNLAKAQAQIESSIPMLASKRLSMVNEPSVIHSAKSLSGDLDKIVAHALKKEAHERYLSVDQFSADIERFLRQEPISLRSSVTSYRARKFIQRYKLAVALSAALILGLVTASVAMFMQQQRLKVERDNALSQQSRAEQVTQLLTNAFEAADPSQNRGNEVKAREVLDQAALRLKDAKLDPEAYVKLSVTLANVYRSLGLVQESRALAEAAALQIAYLTSAEIKMQLLHLLARVYKDAGERAKLLAMITQAAQLTEVTNPNLRIDQRMLEIDLIPAEGNITEGIRQAKLLDAQTAAQFGASSPIALRTGAYYLDKLAAVDRDQEATELISSRLGTLQPDDYSADHLNLLMERVRIDLDASRIERAKIDVANIKNTTIKLYGRNHLMFVRALDLESRLMSATGAYAEAKKITLNCADIINGLYPSSYPIHAKVLNNLSVIENNLQEFDLALKHAQEAIVIVKAALGAEHQSILTFETNMAEALIGKEQFEAAEHLLLEIIKKREYRSEGKLTPFIISSTTTLAKIYEKTHRRDLALVTLNQLSERIEKIPNGRFAFTDGQLKRINETKNRLSQSQ